MAVGFTVVLNFMLHAKGVRNIILGKLEVMGPRPAEVRYVENKLGDDPKAAIQELPDSLIESWLTEFSDS